MGEVSLPRCHPREWHLTVQARTRVLRRHARRVHFAGGPSHFAGSAKGSRRCSEGAEGGSLAFGLMPLHVERQMIGPGEGPFADSALERLGARVLAVVAGQLIGPGEAPLAFWPLAMVGLLACAGETENVVLSQAVPVCDCPLRGNRGSDVREVVEIFTTVPLP